MKRTRKLSQKKRTRLLKLDIDRFETNQKRKNKHYSSGISSFDNGDVAYEDSGRVRIDLPVELDLNSSHDDLADVLRKIRRSVLRYKKSVTLHFEGIKKIKPSALLLVTAEIHRCRMIRGKRNVTGTYPTDPNIERILEDSGVFNLIGVNARNKRKPKVFPMEYIDFISETSKVEGQVSRFRESILGKDINMSPHVRSRFYRALTEAMLNVHHHAYPVENIKTNPGRGRWWLTGHVNKKTKDLVVMFCDLGVGIPKTLPRLYTMELIRNVLSILPGINPDDGDMIKAAMQLGRTRTNQTNRGKGLNDIRSFIEQANSGSLEIYSSKGFYQYKPNNDEVVKNFSSNIGGTLIVWTVPLATVTNWVDSGVLENEPELEV